MKEQSSSVIGLVDVLIGAMSAVLLLFIAQITQPRAKSEYGADQASLKIEIDYRTSEPRPNLAVRFRVNGGRVLDLADARKSEPRVILLGVEDGFHEITINFKGGARFDDDEDLLVYIHDLDGRPAMGSDMQPNPIHLRATLTAANQTVHWTTEGFKPALPVLTAESPAVAVKLADVCGQVKLMTVAWRSL